MKKDKKYYALYGYNEDELKPLSTRQQQYPNLWEIQGQNYQYPGYQPQDAYGYQNPLPPVDSNIFPKGEMQISTTANTKSSNSSGNNIGNVGMSAFRNIGSIMSSIATGAPQLINALLPDQPLEEEDRTLPMAINPYKMGTGSQAIYKDGGEIARDGYRKRKRKQGNIQITEEIPEALPVDTQAATIPTRDQYQIPQIISQFQPELRPLPQQSKRVEFEKLLDTEGNLTGYSPIFSNNYNYWEAMSAMQALPEQFGGVPVMRNPETYADLWEGFMPASNAYDWTKSNPNFKNGGKIDYQVGQEVDLTQEQLQDLLNRGYEIEF